LIGSATVALPNELLFQTIMEIKFRAVVKEDIKKVIYDVTSINFADETVWLNDNGEQELYDFKDVVIISYSGKKDKRDFEIWEGDLMVAFSKDGTEMIGEVYLDKEFRVKYGYRYPKEGQRKEYFFNGIFGGEEWEVIGNIYQNKDLVVDKYL